MAAPRSPNYPSMSLGPALEAIRIAFQKENRNKMSRSVLAKHLGYSSLNGRALAKLGAVRAYGLIDGSGDELRISDDAVTALMAPAQSQERAAALSRLARRPTLFQELTKAFPDTMPSLENLKFNLVQRKYTQEAAEKAAKSYLATMNLAAGIQDEYNPPDEEIEDGESNTPVSKGAPAHQTGGAAANKVKTMAGERELTTGLLSKEANFRVLVSGPVGVKEIERLIAKLTFDKEILAEPDDGNDDLVG